MKREQLDHAAIIEAANDLIDTLDEMESFEAECGCMGEGPIVQLCAALGRKLPPNLKRWLKDND